jgi:hypothetical protein
LEKEDIFKLLEAAEYLKPSQQEKEVINSHVDSLYKRIDKNHDDKISLEEFTRAAKSHQLMKELPHISFFLERIKDDTQINLSLSQSVRSLRLSSVGQLSTFGTFA